MKRTKYFPNYKEEKRSSIHTVAKLFKLKTETSPTSSSNSLDTARDRIPNNLANITSSHALIIIIIANCATP
jgi:hypothetical protein